VICFSNSCLWFLSKFSSSVKASIWGLVLGSGQLIVSGLGNLISAEPGSIQEGSIKEEGFFGSGSILFLLGR
jgi:hypothetical protein